MTLGSIYHYIESSRTKDLVVCYFSDVSLTVPATMSLVNLMLVDVSR